MTPHYFPPRSARTSAAAFGLVAVVSSVSANIVVFDQPNDRADQPSFFSDAIPGQFFSQRMADDFTLSESSEITAINWCGGSQNFQFPDLTNMESFVILVLRETNGLPDVTDAVVSRTVSVLDSDPTPTGLNVFGGGAQFAHHIELPTPVMLEAGTRYWLSIGATLQNPFGDAWVWSGSNSGNLVNATDFFNGDGFVVFNPTFNDLAFQLVAVPEPATAIFAFAAFAVITRRRR